MSRRDEEFDALWRAIEVAAVNCATRSNVSDPASMIEFLALERDVPALARLIESRPFQRVVGSEPPILQWKHEVDAITVSVRIVGPEYEPVVNAAVSCPSVVDYSDAAISMRIRQVSQLRKLCLSLGKATPIDR